MARRFFAGLAVLALLPSSAPRVLACAPAPPAGQHVDVADEEALIVWDPATHTQHFIRRARFRSSAMGFGFLVPTPSRPTLAEAPDAIFAALARAIEPEVVMRTRRVYEPIPILLWPFYVLRGSPPQALGPAGGVRVLETRRVAGYDAAVLEADDTGALLLWLQSHGYSSRPELQEWLRPYVEQRWILSAFKVGGGEAGSGEIATSAVRMSFETERPFFPYREPADQRQGGGPRRLLRVFAVAASRLEGKVGNEGAWVSRLLYAKPRADLGRLLGGAVPGLPNAAAPWLLAWEDGSTPRPGTDDLFFSPDPDQAAVVPPPIVVDFPQVIPIPVDVIALLAFGAWWLRRRARKRAAA